MTNDNLTLGLEGEVSISDFAAAISGLNRLIKSLTESIAGRGSQIEWVVTELEAGSASATITGYAENPQDVYSVVEGYSLVGKALEGNRPIPYSEKVRKEAENLKRLLDGQVTALKFGTPEGEAVVGKEEAARSELATVTTFGAIEGKVQTLTERQGVRFTLFDSLYDRPVLCFPDSEKQDELREVWGRRAIVEGMVTREARTGRPLSIRRISAIRVLPEAKPGAFRLARGALKLEEPAEKAIRRVRDAW